MQASGADTELRDACTAQTFDSRAFLRTVPDAPGVYRMLDAQSNVLYVGKAKRLKHRLASYFQRRLPSPRIALMVSQIAAVDITITLSESEALLLENNLIKTLKPKYNILFRDDKTYPYILISNDTFPRLAYYRGSRAQKAQYFGPFPNAYAVRESIQLLQKTFRLRTCENSVFNNRSRPCLLFQIKRCSAPCVDLIDEQAYKENIRLASRFLRGQTHEVIELLSEKMAQCAQSLNYEQAGNYRDQIRALQTVRHQQYIENARQENVDIIVAIQNDNKVCINLAMVRAGRHLGDRPMFPKGECDAPSALMAFIEQHYRQYQCPDKLIVNMAGTAVKALIPEISESEVQVSYAKTSSERAWIKMSLANAHNAIASYFKTQQLSVDRLDALKQALNWDNELVRMECFDISHTQGEKTVASCVVCENGVMKPSDYRRFNIRGITPGDDYAAMRQVLQRRYQNLNSTGKLPDLVWIDGGKGQLHAADEALAELGIQLPMIGIAKGEGRKPGLETLFFLDHRPPLSLPINHAGLQLLIQIRDEAHRFAITGHRKQREKSRTGSQLDEINGIGAVRRRQLLTAFGGLDGVKSATVEDLCRVKGINQGLAKVIYDALH